MPQNPSNFVVKVLPDGKGGYVWHAEGKVEESYRVEEDGVVKTRVISSTHGFQTVSSPDGKASIVINANVMMPKTRQPKPGKASTAVRITIVDGKEVRTPL